MACSPKIPLVATLLLLAACRSQPIHYHTLMPSHPGGPARGSVTEIQIESVSVPAQVDRPQVVIREGNSGLAFLETEWWGATLAEELRSALVDQLADVNPPHRLSLLVDVQRFDSIPGQYGLIDATWRLRGVGAAATSNASVTCRSTLQTPSGASIDDLVAAQQNNVKRLAALIGQAASNPQKGCPPSQ